MIAVLCNTLRQYKEHFKNIPIKRRSVSDKIIQTKDGKEYYPVIDNDDIVGWEFEDVIKANGYETLEDQTRMRIRK